QVGVVFGGGAQDPAVGGDEFGGGDVVDGQPVGPTHVAHTAGGGDTADAHTAVVPGADRKAVLVQFVGHAAPACPGPQAYPAGLGRSEERRVGKECRSWRSPEPDRKEYTGAS